LNANVRGRFPLRPQDGAEARAEIGGGAHRLSAWSGRAARVLAAWYFHVIHTLAASAMAVIVVVMAVQVFFRYVLNASLIWAEELCRYILIWMAFLFVGIAFHRGEFIAVDVLGEALPRTWRFVLKLIVTIPALVFLSLMVTNGYSYAARFSLQTLPALDFIWGSLSGGGTLNVSIFWVYISVAVGCGLLLMHMLAALVLEAMAIIAGASPPAGSSDGRTSA
jgi:TRAP-type C4-dicarboxylate transport system permease small subunit